METFADRLNWLKENRFQGSWSKMSIACGLPRSHANTLYRRVLTNPRSDVERTTLLKIARGSGVRVEWLAYGTLPRDTAEGERAQVEYDDQFPNRAKAVRAARDLGMYSDEAIAEVQSLRFAGGQDMNPEEWLEEIRSADRRLRRGVAPVGRTAASDLDVEPPGFEEEKPSPRKGRTKK